MSENQEIRIPTPYGKIGNSLIYQVGFTITNKVISILSALKAWGTDSADKIRLLCVHGWMV